MVDPLLSILSKKLTDFSTQQHCHLEFPYIIYYMIKLQIKGTFLRTIRLSEDY